METELATLYSVLVATSLRRLIAMHEGLAGSDHRLFLRVDDGSFEGSDWIEELNDIAVSKFNIDLREIPLERWKQG